MSNAVVQREETIKQGLIAQQKIIKSVLGDKKKSDKFMATAVKVANDYKLRDCHPQSIIDACVKVAQLDLDLSPVLSHAYLVPFKAKKEQKVANVQLIISARGYTALLERGGWKIKSYIVHEGDEFAYERDGFDEKVSFKKNLDGDAEVFKYAVALAQSPDGTLYVETMNQDQIEKHRKVSQNQKGDNPTGVWADWYDEMSLKTVIKKLVKKLPLGETMARATMIDDKPIEAEITETTPQVEASTDLNAITSPQEDPVTVEVEPDNKQMLIETLVQQMKTPPMKTRKYINALDDESVKAYLADPATLEALAEEINNENQTK